jgi:tyrosyl-tRNA synthetase
MEKEERLDLVVRGAEEIVTREELLRLLDEKSEPTAYVGYEPSGKIHLGHLLTAQKLLDLQKAGFRIIVLLADLHAYLNGKGSLEEIQEIAGFNRGCFIAMGLEPSKTEFVLGSEMQLTKEYFLEVQRLALETTLLRARRAMDLIGRAEENPRVARVLYPLMQAIDIAVLGVDLAVGGIDQRKIHMLGRDNLPKLGHPAPICLHLPILHGLDGAEKMSSSKGNFLSVDDPPEEIRGKLGKAFCPLGQVSQNPILEIFRYHVFPREGRVVIQRPEKYGGDLEFSSYRDLEEAFSRQEVHPQDLKNTAAQYMERILSPIRSHLGEGGAP